MSLYKYMTNVPSNSSLCIHDAVHICLFVSLCLSMSFDGGVGEMGKERLDGLITRRHEITARGVTCLFCPSEVTFKHDIG